MEINDTYKKNRKSTQNNHNGKRNKLVEEITCVCVCVYISAWLGANTGKSNGRCEQGLCGQRMVNKHLIRQLFSSESCPLAFQRAHGALSVCISQGSRVPTEH